MNDLLLSADGERNPLIEVVSFRFIAWMLSRGDLKVKDFRLTLSTYLLQRHETRKTPLTLQPGKFGQITVLEGMPILCNDVTAVKSFLADQAKSKYYSNIDGYRWRYIANRCQQYIITITNDA
jgi:hypothetical protein